jgi:hypothetical protein
MVYAATMTEMAPAPPFGTSTDVPPEMQLAFGHALCRADVADHTIAHLAHTLGLGNLIYRGELDVGRLPRHASAGCTTLGTLREAHLIVVDCAPGCHAVFGPHMLFVSSERWVQWNQRVGGLIAIVNQLDPTETSYQLFQQGRYQATAWAKGDSLQFMEEPELMASLARPTTSSPGGREVTPDAESLLARDVTLSLDAGHPTITWRFRPTGARPLAPPPLPVRHFSFRHSAWRRWLNWSH